MNKIKTSFIQILVSLVLIVTIWEFLLEDILILLLGEGELEESFNEKIRYIVTISVFGFLSLILPFKMLIKADKTSDNQNKEEKKLYNARSEMVHIAEELMQLIDTANAPIFGIDTQGKVNEWNQKSAEITGFNADEVLGKCLVQEFITSGYQKSVNEVLQKALQGEETSNYEFPLYTKNNDLVMVLLNATTRRNVNGDVIGVVGVGQDITELDGARAEMARVTEDLMRLIDTANAPIFGIDTQGKINEWNQKSAEITGFNADEVLGKCLVQEFITSGYQKSVNEVLQKALEGEETSNYEFPLYTKNNSLVMVLLNATSRRNANGDVVGVVGVGQDITKLYSARAEMEVKIKERTRELETLLTLSPDGFIFVNPNDSIVYINPALLKMTGFVKNQLMGVSIKAFRNLIETLFDSDQMDKKNPFSGEDNEALVYLSSPTLRVVHYNHKTMLGPTGKKEGEVLYFRDVTHEKEVERMKSEFLSTAAHELRTPLASIYGFSELLMNHDYDKKTTDKTIVTIHRQAHSLKKLLDELLDLSRIEAREGKDFYMKIDSLESVIKQSCTEVEGAFSSRKIDLQSLNYWPKLSFDIDKVRQVLINLLSNAFKYSPENTNVIVLTSEREKGGHWQFGVTIIDQGIGMTPEQISRLGERFYRVDESSETLGTGLGVALVKEIMSFHQGDIDFVSNKGKGMTVTVWFPFIKN